MKMKNSLATLAVVCLFVAVSGCDTVQDSDIVTLPANESFTLEFDGAALDPVKPADVHSASEDIADDLTGFSKQEIVTGGIASIRVERIQPPGVDLVDIVDGTLTIYLEATGAGRVQIGQMEELPSGGAINVPIVVTGQIAPLLKASDYRVALRFTPASSAPDQTIRLRVDVDFEVTFEGL